MPWCPTIYASAQYTNREKDTIYAAIAGPAPTDGAPASSGLACGMRAKLGTNGSDLASQAGRRQLG